MGASSSSAYATKFNGNGHVISKLTVNAHVYTGFFGHLGSGAYVSSLYLEDTSITGSCDTTGAINGQVNSRATVEGCLSTGTVTGTSDSNTNVSAGSIAERNSDGTVAGSYSTGAVTGSVINIGAVMGENDNGTVNAVYWGANDSTTVTSFTNTVGTLVVVGSSIEGWIGDSTGRWTTIQIFMNNDSYVSSSRWEFDGVTQRKPPPLTQR